MTLEENFAKLRVNIFKSFIFYIPENLIPEDNEELRSNTNFVNALNKIILIKDINSIYELKNQHSLYYILQKKSILDTNLFTLLEKKEVLSKNQFSFFIEKYMELIKFCVIVSDWMNKNLNTFISTPTKEVKNSFQYQSDYFSKHFEYLKKHFFQINRNIQDRNIDILQQIETNFPELNNTLTTKFKTDVFQNNKKKNIENNSDYLNTKKESCKKKKKTSIITETEAEYYLLKNVFNVTI